MVLKPDAVRVYIGMARFGRRGAGRGGRLVVPKGEPGKHYAQQHRHQVANDSLEYPAPEIGRLPEKTVAVIADTETLKLRGFHEQLQGANALKLFRNELVCQV
jgi:hypothetical protein